MNRLLPTTLLLSICLMTTVRAETLDSPGTAGPLPTSAFAAISSGRADLSAASRNTPLYSSKSYTELRRSADERAWKRSVVGVIASQSLDVASSYGMRELNSLLASSDGSFGVKAASLKFGTTAAVLGVEYLLVKKYPSAARILSKLNWSSSALTSALAVHNYAIK